MMKTSTMKTKLVNTADILTRPVKRGRKTKYKMLYDLLPGESVCFGLLEKPEIIKIRCACYKLRKSGIKIKTELHEDGKFYVTK